MQRCSCRNRKSAEREVFTWKYRFYCRSELASQGKKNNSATLLSRSDCSRRGRRRRASSRRSSGAARRRRPRPGAARGPAGRRRSPGSCRPTERYQYRTANIKLPLKITKIFYDFCSGCVVDIYRNCVSVGINWFIRIIIICIR